VDATQPRVSVGARDQYNDGTGSSGGTLVTTAVLVKSPANLPGDPAWGYRPTRVDLLFMQQPNQAPNRVCTDFFVTLYSDDGTSTHNPLQQLTTPYLLLSQTPLVSFRAVWLQNDIQQAGWPIMTADTYYWVAVSPSVPLTMPPRVPGGPKTVYNGAVWNGVNGNAGRPATPSVLLFPAFIRNDPNLFTGRELISERNALDSSFYANTPAAVSFLNTNQAWATAPNAETRFTNWQATGSNIRYGIQIIGWQVTPSNSATASRECARHRSLCETLCYRLPSCVFTTHSHTHTHTHHHNHRTPCSFCLDERIDYGHLWHG
jgi:hypothetical protein